jgi:ribosome biogenesis GTPase / thiamine phosphate phosphatase
LPSFTFDALVPYGWNDRVLSLFAGFADSEPGRAHGAASGCLPARITRVERSACLAVGPDGVHRSLRAEPLPAVGDWVATATGAVRHVLPRWSALTRAAPDGKGVQVLAANVDFVAVTTPADRCSPSRVEREVALGWDSGAVPLVVVTKADLDTKGVGEALAARLVGVEVVVVSAATGVGVNELATRLAPDRTAVLLGPSGAGKSTLANALLDVELLATGAVRLGDRRGRHTTTSRQLVAIPSGGVLIDTPGLRSLGLVGDVEIGAGFPDVEALAARCRFSDCHHEHEPGCAVTAAIIAGELDPDRLRSFRKLAREAAAERGRHDPLARQAQRRVWKARTKDARAHDKRRRQ